MNGILSNVNFQKKYTFVTLLNIDTLLKQILFSGLSLCLGEVIENSKVANIIIIVIYIVFKALSDSDKRKVYDKHGEEGLGKSNMDGGDVFSR